MRKTNQALLGIALLAALLLTVSARPAEAVAIWGTDASSALEGERDSSTGGGITGNGAWDSGNFSLSWLITHDDGIWTYVYTATITTKDISHFILEVTEDLFDFNILEGSSSGFAYENGNDASIQGPATYQTSGTSGTNPNMPNSIYGIKFDYGTDTDAHIYSAIYTIVTDRAPVWGVFYAKDGNAGDPLPTAWSNALAYGDYRTNDGLSYQDFIVRPNGVHPVPEPSTFLLVGFGVAGLIFCARRRMKI